MLHRLHGIVALRQLLFNLRESLLAESIMNPSMYVISFITYGCHIKLFLREMLHGMLLEIFDALLISPPTLLVVVVIGRELVHNRKQLSMLPVNGFHPDIESVLPDKFITAHFTLLGFLFSYILFTDST